MKSAKYHVGDRNLGRICPKCGKRTLSLWDGFYFVCSDWECDEYVPVEDFIEDEPELYDEFGDKIVY